MSKTPVRWSAVWDTFDGEFSAVTYTPAEFHEKLAFFKRRGFVVVTLSDGTVRAAGQSGTKVHLTPSYK